MRGGGAEAQKTVAGGSPRAGRGNAKVHAEPWTPQTKRAPEGARSVRRNSVDYFAALPTAVSSGAAAAFFTDSVTMMSGGSTFFL